MSVREDASELSHEQLLEGYIARHDGEAFTTLVRRYGRLVQSVCWRVLRHEQDAAAAFQVTQ